MAVPYSARGSGIKVGVEVTPGTAVSRTLSCEINGSTLTSTKTRNVRGRLSHGTAGFAKDEFVAGVDVGGTVTLPVSYNGLGLLIRAALGAAASSGTGPYTHTYGPAAALPSLTIEEIYGDSGRSIIYSGCKVNSLGISVTPGAEALWSLDIIGMKAAADGSAGSPSYPAKVFAEAYECVVTWGGSSIGTVKSAEATITNGATRRPQVGALTSAEPSVGVPRRATATIVVDKDSFAPRIAETADTTGDLVLTFTDTATGAKTITITLQDCRATVTETVGGAMADLTTSIAFASNDTPTIVIVNAESAYDS
jgi:hypothetical protein